MPMRGPAALLGMGTLWPCCYAVRHLLRVTASSSREPSRNYGSGSIRATRGWRGGPGSGRERSAGLASLKWREGHSARTAGVRGCPPARSPFGRPTPMADSAALSTCDSPTAAAFVAPSTPSGGIVLSSAADVRQREGNEPAGGRRLVRLRYYRGGIPACSQLTFGFHSANMPLGFGRHAQMCSAHTLSGGPSFANSWPSSTGGFSDRCSGTI